MKKTILFLVVLCSLACQQNHSKKQASTPASLPELSIYHLPSEWTTNNYETIELKSLKGKVVVTVMIYTSCKAACPRLIADMQNILEKLNNVDPKKLVMLLISIDPKTDTPEHLNAFAKENKMDQAPWLFLRGSASNTREFAAVLGMKYKKISPLDFSHSNLISVFNAEGELVHQQEGLTVNNEETVKTIQYQLNQIP